MQDGPGGGFFRVWCYDVPLRSREAFTTAYGSAGDWAVLFARHPGFLGVDLYRSADVPGRFITVDRWVEEASWTSFLEEHREDYDRLDRELDALGAREWPLGDLPADPS